MKTLHLLPLCFLPLLACAIDPSAPDETSEDENVGEIASDVTRAPLSVDPKWAIMIGGYGSWCSGSVIAERWILTAAHCVVDQPENMPNFEVSDAPTAGGMRSLYRGPARRFINPEYHGPSNAVHDMALVYLSGYGLNIGLTGKAKLYADARKPWRSTSESAAFFISGFGLGSDVGTGGTNCDTLPGQRKRVGSGFRVDRSIFGRFNTHFATAPIGDTHACGGDSGGQWLLKRGAGADEAFMQFAVHSGRRGSPTKHQGPLIDDNMAWIESTVQNMPVQFGIYWPGGSHGGYQYKSAEIIGRGFTDVRGLAGRCMTSMGSAGAAVQNRTCAPGSMAQSWSWFPSGEFRSAGAVPAELCLEVTGASTVNRTPTRVATCNGSLAQKFQLTPAGELRSALNFQKCVEVQGGFTADGTTIQLYDCNGTASQIWAY